MGGVVSAVPYQNTVNVINSITSAVGLINTAVNLYFDVQMRELEYKTYKDRNTYYAVNGQKIIADIRESSGFEDLSNDPTPENFINKVNNVVRSVDNAISMYPRASGELYDFKIGFVANINETIKTKGLNIERKSTGKYVLIAETSTGKKEEYTGSDNNSEDEESNNVIWYVVGGASLLTTVIAIYLVIRD